MTTKVLNCCLGILEMGAMCTHACHGSTREKASRSAGMGEMGKKAGFLEEELFQLSFEE